MPEQRVASAGGVLVLPRCVQKAGVEKHHRARRNHHIHDDSRRIWCHPLALRVQSASGLVLEVEGVRPRDDLKAAILLIRVFQVDAAGDDPLRGSPEVVAVLVPVD